MLSFEQQNDKEKFNNAITRQGEREGFIVKKENDEYSVAFNLEHEKGKKYYPIGFKGKAEEKDGQFSRIVQSKIPLLYDLMRLSSTINL